MCDLYHASEGACSHSQYLRQKWNIDSIKRMEG